MALSRAHNRIPHRDPIKRPIPEAAPITNRVELVVLITYVVFTLGSLVRENHLPASSNGSFHVSHQMVKPLQEVDSKCKRSSAKLLGQPF